MEYIPYLEAILADLLYKVGPKIKHQNISKIKHGREKCFRQKLYKSNRDK